MERLQPQHEYVSFSARILGVSDPFERRAASGECLVPHVRLPPPLITLGTKLTNLLPVSTSMPTRSSYPSGMEALRAVGDLPVWAGAKAAAEPTRAAVIAAAVFMVATRIDCGKKKGEGG